MKFDKSNFLIFTNFNKRLVFWWGWRYLWYQNARYDSIWKWRHNYKHEITRDKFSNSSVHNTYSAIFSFRQIDRVILFHSRNFLFSNTENSRRSNKFKEILYLRMHARPLTIWRVSRHNTEWFDLPFHGPFFFLKYCRFYCDFCYNYKRKLVFQMIK